VLAAIKDKLEALLTSHGLNHDYNLKLLIIPSG
jgi:hypothetical protein